MLFFICTISSPFFAFDKAKLLGSGLIFFSALYKKSQSAECISFRTVSVSPVFSVCEGLAQSQSLLPRSKTEDIGSGSAHLGNGRLQKARHGGFLLVESEPSRCLSCQSFKLLSSFTLLCVCTHACVHEHACMCPLQGHILNGEACLRLSAAKTARIT